jgi:CheY-like chemotaxis protein
MMIQTREGGAHHGIREDVDAQRADIEVEARPRARVLIVDDNRDAADLVALLLDLRGHVTEVAYGAADAERKARANRPDVAFLDLGMPGTDGFALARRFREDPYLCCVRLVALTGWGAAEDRARTKEAGFDGHLTKPAGIEALENALQREKT